ncbi:hypothetical protein QQ054_29410 [Oscillatoria amoena NRMC-F 0135]|nr:hypothetical protein [Oscillatoria amoena NRMC-F 0135]
MVKNTVLILIACFTLAFCSEKKETSVNKSSNVSLVTDDSLQRIYPFQAISWDSLPRIEHAGVSGTVSWYEVQLNGLRLRSAEFSPGFSAEFCDVGHIVYCIDGESTIKIDERVYRLIKGMAFVVSGPI